MASLRLQGLSKSFGERTILGDVDLEVGDGELFAVLGPSGCGKTTLLRMVAGFIAPDRGRVLFGERDVTALPPERRDAAMVFQSYALFPHLDVAKNVAFGLRARKVAAASSGERVLRALALVGLEDRGGSPVGDLSGGEQQRVALARALVVEPPLLLLDEPMSNLDQKLREETRGDVRALQRRLGITTLYVTHDQHDALEMADRLAVIDGGRIIQVGTPRELYDRPASELAATFLGHANILTATLEEPDAEGPVIRLGDRRLRAVAGADAAEAAVGSKVRVAVRPESVTLGTPAAGDELLGEAIVTAAEFRGATVLVELELSDQGLRAVALNRGGSTPERGTRVRVSAPRDRVVVLSS